MDIIVLIEYADKDAAVKMTQSVQNETWLRISRPIRVADDLKLPLPAVDAGRLACVDLLRGAAMILMALDHTRDFFTGAQFGPEVLAHTSGPIFFTRWVTHFCAPIFFLLAGTGTYLSLSRGKSLQEVSRFLWTRGIWLVILDLTVVSYGWTCVFPNLFAGVLWALGWSMIAMALLIRLPLPAIAVFGTGMILTHNLLDRLNPASFGKFAWLWLLLHGHGPWLGVMAIGYCLGALLQRGDWRKIVLTIGSSAVCAFFILRFFRLYSNGDQSRFGSTAGPWQLQPTLTLTIVSFFDTLKYPASLQYLLMTLGPSLIALGLLSKVNPNHWVAKFVAVFGRVPLFFYVVHIYVVHVLAIYTALLFKQPVDWLLNGAFMLNMLPEGYGHGPPFIYGMWIVAVLLMYPLCWLFLRFKQRHPDCWWPRYL